jgi:ubiquinone/menaquinone biosynthesis C-methylase UbiE
MNNEIMYDQFSADYDHFVNWEGRLSIELPFLTSELAEMNKGDGNRVSVLDAACGTGQHVIALAQHGFECSGADLSRKMVEIAQTNARTENLEIDFKKAGFGQLSSVFSNQKFDSLLCLGNSLPHVLDEAAMLRTLADFKSVLNSGAKIIIQNRNFDNVKKTRNRWMQPETHREGQNTWIFVRFYDFDPDGILTFNIMILTDQQGGEFQQRVISTRLWPFTQVHLVDWLDKTGFENICLFGDLQGSPFNIETSSNLVVTARA